MEGLVDVSEHNGLIDWGKVRDAGYHAIIRCGYGGDYQSQDDKRWRYNVEQCNALGIPYGVYLYSYANGADQARSEAAHALRCIREAGAQLSYPLFYDLEEARYMASARRCAEAFGDVVEASGLWCGVYASLSWFRGELADLDRFTKWVASWGSSKPSVANMGIWQYTNTGRVPGIDGNVDLNRVYVDYPAMIGSPSAPSQDDVDALVREVYEGRHGIGADRVASLGSRYQAVQARINQLERLAYDVMAGKYGNGDARKAMLGSDYDMVQYVVNRKMGFRS